MPRMVSSTGRGHFRFPASGAPSSTGFAAQWQPMLLGDGGNAQGVHVFPSGTVLSHVDTYNGFLYNGSTATSIGAKTLPTPAWKPMFRSDNISGRTALQFLAGTNTGVGEIAEHPGNTNYFMAIVDGRIWISANRGANWAATSRTVTFGTNAGPIQTRWICGDPNDPTGGTWIVNTPSQGAFRTTNATLLGSATFSAISGVTASSTNGGGSVFFDIATSGGSQKIWISSDGIGVYQCNSDASSCTLLNSAGMPTRTGVLIGDKFGQLWSGTGFYSASLVASVYASGAWSSKTIANIHSNDYCTAIVFDPNTGSTVGNNQVIAVLSRGDLSCSLNNGTDWTAVGNGTISSTGNQAAWLGTAKQDSGGIVLLNVNDGSIDSSGNVWVAGGISIWTTTNPIVAGVVQSSVNWTANSIGIEQLVVSCITVPPGLSPLSSVWDRALIRNRNPDDFADVQYPQNKGILEENFNVDYALASGSSVASTRLVIQVHGTSEGSAYSDNGGRTWTDWPAYPASASQGGIVAVSTSSCWACVPGNGNTEYSKVYCTPDSGANWYQATGFTGTPSFVPNNNRANGTGHITLVADKSTAGVFYAFDCANSKLYKSTNGNTTSPSFSLVSTPTLTGMNLNGKVKLTIVPGNPTNLWISGYPQSSSNIFKSTDSGATFAVPAGASSKGFENISGYGLGAAKPGGSGYPTIYLVATASGVPDPTLFYSTDAGATFNLLNVPASQQTYPINSMDYPTWVTGDPNVYGRVYYGFTGSGCAYIDMADAVPWVNFSNREPNEALSGAVTLTARHSGLVPVSLVQFSVDGVNIGVPQTGQSSYSVSWNASSVSAGSHILTVTATGSNGQGSFSIPITTS